MKVVHTAYMSKSLDQGENLEFVSRVGDAENGAISIDSGALPHGPVPFPRFPAHRPRP
ncbi:protein of unknown function [Ectopseudomonas oleovorans]|nr:protein of unknown function [Pseudomonas oleovorans]